MLHLCRNQVVGFYEQNVWKDLWKSEILSKDAGHRRDSETMQCLLESSPYLRPCVY